MKPREKLRGGVGKQRQKGLRAGESCFEHCKSALVQIYSVRSEKTVGIIVSFYVIKSAHAPNFGKWRRFLYICENEE